jgi:hypothetical protein
MPTITNVPEHELARWRREGLIVGEQSCGPVGVADGETGRVVKRKVKPAELHATACMWHDDKLLIVVAIQTANETNHRQWKAKNRRAGEAWRRTREAVRLPRLLDIERTLRDGNPVKVEFCRLAPKDVDKGSIGACCKGVEDALAYLCGIDDGSPLWQSTYIQERSKAYGIRVIMQIVK